MSFRIPDARKEWFPLVAALIGLFACIFLMPFGRAWDATAGDEESASESQREAPLLDPDPFRSVTSTKSAPYYGVLLRLPNESMFWPSVNDRANWTSAR